MVQLSCVTRRGRDVYFSLLYLYVSEVIFHSRVIGACSATTDCIVLRRGVNVRTKTTATCDIYIIFPEFDALMMLARYYQRT